MLSNLEGILLHLCIHQQCIKKDLKTLNVEPNNSKIQQSYVPVAPKKEKNQSHVFIVILLCMQQVATQTAIATVYIQCLI